MGSFLLSMITPAFLPDLQFHRVYCRDSFQRRYAIRAGRNLPDKEFRYLRTVIVTAAVHQGLDSSRKALLVTFWHWAGVSPYTYSYEFAETCVFAKQSVEIFNCGQLLIRNKQLAMLIPKLRMLFCRVP